MTAHGNVGCYLMHSGLCVPSHENQAPHRYRQSPRQTVYRDRDNREQNSSPPAIFQDVELLSRDLPPRYRALIPSVLLQN